MSEQNDIPPERALVRTPEPKAAPPEQPAHRQQRFAYVDESRLMGQPDQEPDVPQEPMPLRFGEPRLLWGPYKGVPLSEVPIEHLEWQRDAFENGPDPDVVAELRRREKEQA